jgi:putative PIN family toxin of toxin-antitoxin system
MPGIVPDSSVLISAFITPGGAVADLLRKLVASGFELYLSSAIIEETASVLLTRPRLRRYASYSDDNVKDYLAWLARISVLVDKLPEIEGVCRDPADDVIIATAVAARATWLVTGDQDLLVLEAYEGIAIVSPRQMLDELERPAGHSDS